MQREREGRQCFKQGVNKQTLTRLSFFIPPTPGLLLAMISLLGTCIYRFLQLVLISESMLSKG